MTAAAETSVFDFLRKVPYFSELPAADLKRLCAVVREVSLAAGDVLFVQGSPGDFAYVIKEGEVEISRLSDGREVPLAVRGQGEVIGEMALLEEAPRMAAARALTDSALVAIGRQQLDDLLASSPSAARAMLRTVMTRLRETEASLRQSEKMAQLGTLTAGMAHELNNPAAAALRGAEQLRAVVGDLLPAQAGVAALSLSPAQLSDVAGRMEAARRRAAQPEGLSALERGDRQEAIESWFEQRRMDGGDRVAAELAELGYDPAELEKLAGIYSEAQLARLLPLICAAYQADTLVDQIARGAREIAAIVKALKSYVYLDQAPVQDVDIHEGLENTLIILRHKLKTGVTVKRDYTTRLPRVPAHGSELNQVWTNLIDNAADALGGKGEITLRTRSVDSWVVVEVEDSGPGIPPEIQPKVFTLFFTTKPIGVGSGQGLNTAYNVVRRHAGTIDFDSRPGRTVFTVRIPVSKAVEAKRDTTT